MHKLAVATFAFASVALAQAPKTEDEKTIYALGIAMGKSARELELSKAEFEILKKGLQDAYSGAKPQIDFEAYRPKIGTLAQSRKSAAEGKILEKYAREKGAQKLPSGLIYFETRAGTGPSPKATDTVKVHYRGTLTDGTEFDSSYGRGEPTEFPLNGVIPCWTEGVQKMKVGGKARLVCPAKIAYGDRGAPPKIGPGATLVFEIELLEVKNAAK